MSFLRPSAYFFFFFFNDTATTEIYTLSLHDALPICITRPPATSSRRACCSGKITIPSPRNTDRKSTRLNSSHITISYAVFCLKKKKQNNYNTSYPKTHHTDTQTPAAITYRNASHHQR